MLVVAGPPGSGKSTAFPLSSLGLDHFNADDRAAQLHGSYHSIPPHIRSQVNREFEQFVQDHINNRQSFALETTLRAKITFDQARRAKDNGFTIGMRYVALDNVELHLERIAIRAQSGGHAASERTLRSIHRESLKNLPEALRLLDDVAVFDNSRFEQEVQLLMETERGRVVHLNNEVPAWLKNSLIGTEYEITDKLRDEVARGLERDDPGIDR